MLLVSHLGCMDDVGPEGPRKRVRKAGPAPGVKGHSPNFSIDAITHVGLFLPFYLSLLMFLLASTLIL